jgi:DNA-binding transcriptional LysR family regulator
MDRRGCDTRQVDPHPALRDIECFTLVADRLSFSGAAAELGISQPAVSQAVARLERALGIRLFERTSREVQLTDAGKVLLPYAVSLLTHSAAFTDQASRLVEPDGIMRIAYCPVVGSLVARVVRQVASQVPGLDVELRPEGWSAATADLARGAVCAAWMAAPFPPHLPMAARFDLPLTHVAVPAGSPLASATRLHPGQFARQLLLPRTPPRGSVWAQLAADRPDRSSATDLDDLPAALDLVAAGRGVLIVPGLLAETTRRADLTFVPLHGISLRMKYALVWNPDRAPARMSTVVQAAQDMLRSSPGRLR